MSDIKLGFGFYRHMLDAQSYRFARQCGATHAVVHLVDYTHQGGAKATDDQPVGTSRGGASPGQRKACGPLRPSARYATT
ncbi:MAG: hypothetical protein U5K81_00065 [Trueperaceae bacterium]|nr:hypothetical protein [Trueperaceae bacterium]